jgi:hypothetical protein
MLTTRVMCMQVMVAPANVESIKGIKSPIGRQVRLMARSQVPPNRQSCGLLLEKKENKDIQLTFQPSECDIPGL